MITKTEEFWLVKFKIKQKHKVRRLLDEDFAKSINWNAKNNDVKLIFQQEGEEFFAFEKKEDQEKFIKDLQTLCNIRSISLQFHGSSNPVPLDVTFEDENND